MNKEMILNDLQAVFKQVLKRPDLEVTPELTAAKVPEWDSLSHLVLITEVEKHFQIKFKLKELISMGCVGDMIHLIETKTASNS
jgi:acyl carrier protein